MHHNHFLVPTFKIDMRIYSLQDITDDIINSIGLNLNDHIVEIINDVFYLRLFSQGFDSDELRVMKNEYNDDLKLSKVAEFLNKTIHLPVGTYVPDGDSLILYEVYETDGNHICEYSLSFTEATKGNMLLCLDRMNSMDFHSNKAFLLDLTLDNFWILDKKREAFN